MDDAKTSTTVYVMISKIFRSSIVLDVIIIQNQIAGFASQQESSGFEFTFLCEVCMLSLCFCGFSSCKLDSNSPNTYMLEEMVTLN